jgi:hypothetical protein
MSIPLRFPSMLVHVAPGTRFEMAPDVAADKVVEYHIGDPAVCFVVAREEIPEESFFGVQLALRLKDVGRGADGALRVVLSEHSPLLFPLAFDYMRQVFATPSTARLHTAGLDEKEAERLAELVEGFLMIENPRMALLFRANAPRFDAAEFRVVARGRLIENMKRSRFGEQPSTASTLMVAGLSSDGVVTCMQSNGAVCTTVTVSLRKIPVSVPWARSIMQDEILALQVRPRCRTREGGPHARRLRPHPGLRRAAPAARQRRRPHAVPVPRRQRVRLLRPRHRHRVQDRGRRRRRPDRLPHPDRVRGRVPLRRGPDSH